MFCVDVAKEAIIYNIIYIIICYYILHQSNLPRVSNKIEPFKHQLKTNQTNKTTQINTMHKQIQNPTQTQTQTKGKKEFCNYCGKDYTRKTSLHKHVLLCEIIHKSKREQICEKEETTDVPTVTTLYHIIQELAGKYETLSKTVEQMQQYIQQKKNKINIIDWLNQEEQQSTTQPPKPSLQSWMQTIQIEDKHIQLLMDENIVSTFNSIIEDNANPKHNNPFACFIQKSHMIYVKNEPIQAWESLTPENFILLTKQIHSRLLKKMCDWRNANAKQIAENEKMSELYNKTIVKLMSVNFTSGSTHLSKIRTYIYTTFKVDFHPTLEVE